MRKINVLVTGAGSGVGQSIIKALNLSTLNLNILSSDINVYNAGLYRTKKSLIIPPVEKKDSLKRIIKIIKENNIQVLFIGSEYEIKFFAENKDYIEKKTKVNICVSSSNIIDIANDKFKTFQFLKKNNFMAPKSFLINNKNINNIYDNLKKPFILKNRFGTSSREVFLIKNKKEFLSIAKTLNFPMAQENLRNNDKKHDEYTCSIFRDKNGKFIGPFISQRFLKHGTSWILKTIENKKLSNLVKKIAHKLNNYGTINIQFMKKNNQFLPIEINSRFSGTTSIRASFCFNEPEMYIKNFFLNKKIKEKKIKKGFVFRYVEEIFLDNNLDTNLKSQFSKGKKIQWF
jgi:carbamoyl-phosphate synthase large subunit